MIKLIVTVIMYSIFLISAFGQKMPKVVSGEVIRYDTFPSNFIKPRTVDIWLPAGYSVENKYPVLYMHDGQNLFDSTTTWNNQEWMLDEIMTDLVARGKIDETIVVGIWNIPAIRHPELFPQQVVEDLSEQDEQALSVVVPKAQLEIFKKQVGSDNYLSFIVKELKPFVDQKYSTIPGRDHTFISGASMGGLMSLYALCEYPETFGGAACISTHWPGIYDYPGNPIPKAFASYVEKELPAKGFHKIYFDFGDQTLDSTYAPHQKMVNQILEDKGWSAFYKSQYFPGHDHSERSWQKRFDQALLFIMGKD